MFCREQVARVVDRRDEIEALGARVVVIGNGTTAHARAFLDSESVDLDIYVDPDRVSYAAFGMKSGIGVVANPRTLAHGGRAIASGFRQSATRGSTTQIGGVVVFDETGEELYRHIESEAGDIADYDEVIDALR